MPLRSVHTKWLPLREVSYDRSSLSTPTNETTSEKPSNRVMTERETALRMSQRRIVPSALPFPLEQRVTHTESSW